MNIILPENYWLAFSRSKLVFHNIFTKFFGNHYSGLLKELDRQFTAGKNINKIIL